MKYDVLSGFQNYLKACLNKNTAKTYYSAVKNVFADMSFNSLDQISSEAILDRVAKLDSKNKVSAAKNGLKFLKEYDDKLQLPTDEGFSNISAHKRNHVKSKGKRVDFDLMQKKVNSLKNQKFKLAFRLASVSGLRVSELAALEAKDLHFGDNGKITVSVRNGKGGKSGQVECLQDTYLYGNLKKYCDDRPDGRLFYGESYMRQKARSLGMEMHDFRRAFAVLKKNQCIEEGSSAYEANAQVQEGLRHSRFSTTKRYLYGRKIVIKKKKIKKAVPKDIPQPSDCKDFKVCTNDYYDMCAVADCFDLSSTEQAIFKSYTDKYYELINGALNSGNIDDTLTAAINTMADCIDRKKIPDDIILYRGIPDATVLFKEDVSSMSELELNNKFSSKLFRHACFASTSISSEVAKSFTGSLYKTKSILEINIPKGSKGIFIGDISCYPKEDEVIIQRDSIFRINEMHKVDDIIVTGITLEKQIGGNHPSWKEKVINSKKLK